MLLKSVLSSGRRANLRRKPWLGLAACASTFAASSASCDDASVGGEKKTLTRSLLPGDDITPASFEGLLIAVRKGSRIDEKSLQMLGDRGAHHFKQQPNIVQISLTSDVMKHRAGGGGCVISSGGAGDGSSSSKGRRLNVFGDIHGQLADLLHGIGVCGTPSVDNMYLFNGDFTDRGSEQTAVAAVVLAMALAFPGLVYVNR